MHQKVRESKLTERTGGQDMITMRQGCGNSEPTDEHFDLYSSLLSYSPYNLYTVWFQFTEHSLDNVLHDWLFPHHYLLVTQILTIF